MSESEQTGTTDMDVTGNADATETPNAPEAGEQNAAYWQAEAEKWKAQSRKHETEYKKLAKATKPAEKPQAEATSPSDEVAKLRAEWAREKAQDKLDAAAAKAGVDVSDILDFVAVDKFIDGTSVDVESINDFVGKFAAKQPKAPEFAQDIGVGPQAGGSTQLGKDDLARMSPQEIVKAEKEGRFNHLLGRK